ncbi:Hypothetical protein NTJ_01462 [Nesidiocoris tenuis]|uniref:Uncharacterized protein n=1 Tax=Nesidiocoris tenuis TaxID=355587 RepID=A0ABN7A8X2_9HEMI|nr:Hypothetical protein NTJ_01462 [Nesidiocoris tenuis]
MTALIRRIVSRGGVSEMCKKIYRYCRKIYDQKSWWSKLLALVVIICYFVAVMMTHDQPYLWLTLTLAVLLCLTTLACSRDDPIIAFRRGGPTPRSSIADDQRQQPLEIWVTDVPPSYSFVMGNATPPPSYGSAIFKFPALAAAAEKLEKSEGMNNTSTGTPMLRRVLDPSRFRSISRQVSEIGRLSRQVSESRIGHLSRQSSLNASEIGADAEDWESGIVIIVPPRIRRSTSQGSDAFPAMNKPNENDPGSTSEKVQGDSKELIHTTGADLERGADCDGPMTAYTCNDNGKPRTVIVFQVTNWNEERGEGSNNIEKTENESSHLQKDENVSSYLPEDLNESNETDVREAQGEVTSPQTVIQIDRLSHERDNVKTVHGLFA